jgi:hypothetical protein
MRRKRRAPITQLARAGERTQILTADKPVDEVRFRATVLDGQPAGRIEIDTGDPLPRTAELGPENRLDTTGMKTLAIIPDRDTAITFLNVNRPGSTWVFAGGIVLVGAAVGLTLYDMLGG